MKNKEIERKFLIDINKVPYDFNILNKKAICQGYILANPEIRVRGISNENYYMTIKSDTEDPLIRNEIEFEISKEAYNKLMAREDVYKLNKTRYSVWENDNKYEIDIFEGNLKGLACLEVEFENKDKAKDFSVPEWAYKEVTNDIRYRSGFLAKNSIPLDVK